MATPTHPLEPGRAEMEAMGRAAVELAAGFVEGLPEAPAVALEGAHELARELRRPPGEEPQELEALLRVFGRAAAAAVETAGPGYLAYIPGGGLFTSALAELLARVVNRYSGLSSFAPALVAMEESVVRWACDQFGLPQGAGGLITTGGSLATLPALVAARHHGLGEDLARATLYVGAHTHHSVTKAARIAGLPRSAVRTVPSTSELRMDPAAAARMVAEDRAAGRRPFLLVATAGTTDTGTVDPLPELGSLARREGLWLHVDAAYGGFFQLTERGRVRMAGIEAADSIVLDPHKGMFLPYGTGLLLVRDAARLRAAHTGEAHYLQDAGQGDGGSSPTGQGDGGSSPTGQGDGGSSPTGQDDGEALPDYADLGPELTREFRGLRLWLPLQVHGVGAFRQALDEKLDLAAYAHGELSREPCLEVPWAPDLSIVAFRARAGDEASQRLLRLINASGRIFISSTMVEGRHTLRLCVLSFRTHADRMREAIGIVRAAARATG